MRLTLRTLLAYLDNTLEPQDAEALRQKITESGFATQLVKRIRETLKHNNLSAPSPEAVGPVEDANVISEYLDSTLPAEQVAEIERACLESEPLLSEAAACHQMLSMILGKPAEVSPQLRQRIYELPDRRIEDIAAASSFSSLTIPASPLEGPAADAVATADTVSPLPENTIQPVGANDSGVSDAPTRLRQMATEAQGSGKAPASAGGRHRSLNDTEIYGGSIRPSRIAPWLVTLALAAVLLFVLAQIFQPLFDRGDADKLAQQQEATTEVTDQVETSDSALPQAEPEDNVAISIGDGDDVIGPDDEPELASPSDPLTSPESTPEVSDVVVQPEIPTPDPTESENTGAQPEGDSPEGAVEVTDIAPPPPPTPIADATAGENTEGGEGTPQPSTSDLASSDTAPPPPDDSSDSPPAEDEVMEVSEDVADNDAAPPEIAKLTSESTLMIGLSDQKWTRITPESSINPDERLVVAPSYRATLSHGNVDLTLVGPAAAQWVVTDDGREVMELDYGRLMIESVGTDATLNLQIEDITMGLQFAIPESRAAISVHYTRQPGRDPLVPENRMLWADMWVVQGSVELTVDNVEETIEAGGLWSKRGASEPEVKAAEQQPEWIDADPANPTSLAAIAREGLLELIAGEQPLEIALREATVFRRTEVAALAAQTLLQLGFGDVYFGGDGILSSIDQRTYWPDHYDSLIAAVNRSAESAGRLREAMVQMDSANAGPLFRLLTGYSQKQLVEGADAQLVQWLDSPSMAVRVLALEHLREITGTTLNFRPEQQNDVRRAPGIKKWEVRQRKGDIRWQ